MDYISVRCPDDKDDLLKISLCIYLTDPFIYPAAFGANIQDASIAISKLMCIKNGLFNINNFVIALYREEICGILLYNEVGAVWNTNECVDMVDKYVPSI